MQVLTSRNYFALFILNLSIPFLFFSCNSEDDLGKYYEGTFNDSVVLVTATDTVNIILEQERTQFHKENIPYSIETFNIADTIKLKLFVSFGSYKQNPKPIKDVSEISDSFYVWYSLKNRMEKTLNKNNSIADVNDSPLISYVSIDSVAVQRGPNKIVSFLSRLIE